MDVCHQLFESLSFYRTSITFDQAEQLIFGFKYQVFGLVDIIIFDLTHRIVDQTEILISGFQHDICGVTEHLIFKSKRYNVRPT